jgi:uncharacterized protein YdiU (UPF0061 family)
MPSPLSQLVFDNSFQRDLPADPERGSRRRQVLAACFSRTEPTPVTAPYLIACSAEAARLIDLSEADCQSQEFLEVFSGNRLLTDMAPYAACYGGHQFGNWAGQLGDGRAITLGEVVAKNGLRWELQLKGAGPTPYSRTADGRAVVRSSLREFLCSEAMHHLGVPTTRALSLIGTGEQVVRDMFYDGRPQAEPGAVVCRMAPSFLRFGSFQLFAARGDESTLEALAGHTLRQHFPELGAPGPPAYAAFFAEVCRRTAHMIAHWMRVGFVHGVMNTDNMSVLGLTIDYGPYGWLEDFDPDWTPNTTDRAGRRYRYANQPRVALWNLVRFAEALAPLIGSTEPLQAGIALYEETLRRAWQQMLLHKLGLTRPEAAVSGAAATQASLGAGEVAPFGLELGDSLLDDLPRVLRLIETDMPIFFRKLADVPANRASLENSSDAELSAPLADAFYRPEQVTPEYQTQLASWLRRYTRRVVDEDCPDQVRRASMHAVNPKYVLRNYLAQTAIDQLEQGDVGRVRALLEVLRKPYEEQAGHAELAEKRPEWARNRPGCSMLSCSS